MTYSCSSPCSAVAFQSVAPFHSSCQELTGMPVVFVELLMIMMILITMQMMLILLMMIALMMMQKKEVY